MIVVVDGMPRSGSTFTFNVARELFLLRGTVHSEYCDALSVAVARSGDADNVVVKSHFPDRTTIERVRSGAAKSVCTIRHPADSVASWLQTFGGTLEEAVGILREWFVRFAEIRSDALILPYGLIEAAPYRATWRIARFVLPFPNPLAVASIARAYSRAAVTAHTEALRLGSEEVVDLGFSYCHRETQFHRRHVRAAPQRLSAADRRRVKTALAEFRPLWRTAIRSAPTRVARPELALQASFAVTG